MNNLVNNELSLSSLKVSKMLSKRHSDLLRDMEIYSNYLNNSIQRNFALNEFWQESTYKDRIGRTLKCYQITKKGCEFLAHKMTGKKGSVFTATYINRFHEMEKQLHDASSDNKLHCTKWRQEKVMTTRDFWQLTGVSQGNINWFLKKFNLKYWGLKGKDLKTYKVINDLNHNLASSMTLIPHYSAIKLVKQLDLWTKELQENFNRYFESSNELVTLNKQEVLPLEKGDIVSIRNEKIIESVNRFKKKIGAVEVLLDELIANRRTRLEHQQWGDMILKLVYAVATEMYAFKTKL